MKDTQDLSVLFLTTACGSTMISKKALKKEVLQKGQVSRHQNAGQRGHRKGSRPREKERTIFKGKGDTDMIGYVPKEKKSFSSCP